MASINKKVTFVIIILVIVVICNELVESERTIRFPYELIPFELTGNSTFSKHTKYPIHRFCLIPEKRHIIKRNRTKRITKTKDSKKNWRTYWSSMAWNAYFLNDNDANVEWENIKEKGKPRSPVSDQALPIVILIAWIFSLVSLNLILYPLISMVVFRAILFAWNLLFHLTVRRILKRLIVYHAKLERENVLQLYADAGRRPPLYRYSLSPFFRENIRDVVPKELDESDMEFWNSDSEIDDDVEDQELGGIVRAVSKKFKKTLEFSPEYPKKTDDTIGEISQELVSHLLKIKKYGMFAVWTQGVEGVDLHHVARHTAVKGFFSQLDIHG